MKKSDTLIRDGLTWGNDDRRRPTSGRKGRFTTGWNHGVASHSTALPKKKPYDPDTLAEKLTWQNLGYRLGRLLRDPSDEFVEEMWEVCTRHFKPPK